MIYQHRRGGGKKKFPVCFSTLCRSEQDHTITGDFSSVTRNGEAFDLPGCKSDSAGGGGEGGEGGEDPFKSLGKGQAARGQPKAKGISAAALASKVVSVAALAPKLREGSCPLLCRYFPAAVHGQRLCVRAWARAWMVRLVPLPPCASSMAATRRHRQAGRQAGRQADRQTTHRHKETQTNTHARTHAHIPGNPLRPIPHPLPLPPPPPPAPRLPTPSPSSNIPPPLSPTFTFLQYLSPPPPITHPCRPVPPPCHSLHSLASPPLPPFAPSAMIQGLYPALGSADTCSCATGVPA